MEKRRELVKTAFNLQSPRIRISEQFETAPSTILAAVREQGLEGVVGKRKGSRYEAGIVYAAPEAAI